jgi:uncharacterized protein (TIGR02118 family)
MQCVTIIYPNKEGAKFDFDYYVKTHIPMGVKIFGNNYEVRRGLHGHDGSRPSFLCVVRLRIQSVDEFMNVMKHEGAKLIHDIPNYTNIEPIIQFDEVLVQGV